MIQKIVVPNEQNFDLSILLPNSYLGKPMHIIFYTEDEVTNADETLTSTLKVKKKPSDYLGILNKEEAEEFKLHVANIRKEWSRDI